MNPDFLNNIHIILDHPYEPGNIGAAARAMANMGFSHLRLIDPRNPHSDECQKMALKAYPIVENARIFDSLEDAVADLKVLFGTTSFRGRNVQTRMIAAREAVLDIIQYSKGQAVGILFGPERSGLSDEQLARCQYLITIPSSINFPTLNLAQSVLIVLYEIFQNQYNPEEKPVDLASERDREQMFRHMEKTLIDIGFLSQSNPAHIMKSIRRFLGKADLTIRDIQIIRGIMSQMDWYRRKGSQLNPEKIKKP